MNAIALFIQKAVMKSITLLLGSTGEIITEKSGNLNLGVPGLMYMGGIAGLCAAYFYENSAAPNAFFAVLLPFLAALLSGAFGALIYSLLTVTLRANQNVTGLALTTFGVGLGNFLGGSLSRMVGGVGQISVSYTAGLYSASLPFAGKLGVFGTVFLSYGFMVYLSIALALVSTLVIRKTRLGLNLKAVGEAPATADAAGINVIAYKYSATCIGGAICGLGGLYFVMDYMSGTWTNNGFGDLGWLAVALVIFSLWKPRNSIWSSVLFGALCISYLYIPGLSRGGQELFKMLPYVSAIVVLILVSMRRKRENQPPASLGLSYFREER